MVDFRLTVRNKLYTNLRIPNEYTDLVIEAFIECMVNELETAGKLDIPNFVTLTIEPSMAGYSIKAVKARNLIMRLNNGEYKNRLKQYRVATNKRIKQLKDLTVEHKLDE